ncbi:MAG TPA: hypothetical protein VEQ41_03500 [Solirubrobacterales bacterium]|nr:hypothetical protein [Solirubrobacterales bacterium]
MKENPGHRDFEEKLLGELKAVVARRGAEKEALTESAARTPGWRLAPRLAVGAAAVLAAAAAVLVFNSGSDNTSEAFAVEPQDGGGVTIEVYSPEDAEGLEAALGEAGIRSQVTWLPAGTTCRAPRFSPSTVRTSLGVTIGGMRVAGPGPAMTIGIMSAEQWRERWQGYQAGEIPEDEYRAATGNINLDPAEFRPDQTVVISGSPGSYAGDPEGGYEAQFAIAEGPVEECEPVRVLDDRLLDDMNRVLESESP